MNGAGTAERLLDPDEPPPVTVLREAGRSEFFLTADHAGRVIPRRLGTLGVSESERLRHIAWDIGIAGVTERLSASLDATAVFQTYSRLVIDCNRGQSVESSIPSISESTEIPGNRDASPAERAARFAEIFVPYHERIRELLDARERAGRRTILVAMHSFTPVFKGVTRPMHAAILYHRAPALPLILLDLMRAEGDIEVGENDPYSVGDGTDYTVPIHGEQRGIPHVEIEIRQDLISDGEGQAAWAARMMRLLTQARDAFDRTQG